MARKRKDAPLSVIILSGGKGHTGEVVVRAGLAQFDKANVQLLPKTNVLSHEAALAAVQEAAELDAVICHTLVVPEIREAVHCEAERLCVPIVDILSPVLRVLDDLLESRPHHQPGLSYASRRDQFDRFDAVDFTLSHDDGARLSDIDGADVVLVGVSRACKSVTCFYLAYRGVRAANVPLIPDFEPPKEILRLDPNKVIGLTLNPQRLRRVREARATRFQSGSLDRYLDGREIARELRQAGAQIAKYGWRCIDVSYQGIEEVAKEVLQMIGEREEIARDD